MKTWTWYQAGIGLAACFLLAVLLVKPIGVSTQFVILDGMIAQLIQPGLIQEDADSSSGYSSANLYLNKSGGKYAKSIAEPMNYGFLFVAAMVGGGLVARLTRKDPAIDQIPAVHTARFGQRPGIRYLLSFLGGVIVLWGARLAGGCTSGHMMSGMMQTAVSGYLFAAAAFAAAVPTALLIYTPKENA